MADRPVVGPNGKLEWGLPTTAAGVIVPAEGITGELRDKLDEGLLVAVAHEREHAALVANCDKIIASYEASLRRLMDHEQTESNRANYGADASGRKWMGDGANGGAAGGGGNEIFRSTFKPVDARGVPAMATNARFRRVRAHNSALPKDGVNFMKNWLYAHVDNPYPSQAEKDLMSDETGLTIKQINNWFINARRRYLVSKVDDPVSQTGAKRTRDGGVRDEYDVYEGDEDDEDGDDGYEQGPW